jgi:hypothetical protein
MDRRYPSALARSILKNVIWRNMKKTLLIIACFAFFTSHGRTQGEFIFFNGTARTRIGTIDGPLAGQGIWAQMLAGTNTLSLTPVGFPLEHTSNGIASPLLHVVVPHIAPHETAYIQMVAWDGTLWGTTLASVPLDQLGRTDIVPVWLSSGQFPDVTFGPQFTQPAIVPIPEPSTVALAVVGAGVLWFTTRARRRKSLPSNSHAPE